MLRYGKLVVNLDTAADLREDSAMDINEAIEGRRSVRDYTNSSRRRADDPPFDRCRRACAKCSKPAAVDIHGRA